MNSSTRSSPFFSVVIPVYNRFALVTATIQSVMDQSCKDFEIIIVDDGSNDGTGQQLDQRYGNNDKVKIIHQENKERGAARNRGFREAKGEYVVFLDSDDILLDDHLKTLYENISAKEFPDFIATKYEFITDGKRRRSSVSNLAEGYYDYHLFLSGNAFACNVCVKRKNERLQMFEEDRSLAIKEDWLFFLKNLRHQRLYLIDKVTLLMLDHEERSMRSGNSALVSKTELARAWIVKNVDLNPDDLRQLDAHVNYFCAIHSYLDNRRKTTLEYATRAMRIGGLKSKYFVVLIKGLVGRKLILRLFHGA